MLSHPSYAVAVLGFAARVSATVRAALRRRVRAPRVLRGTTVGALVLCGLLTMLAVAEAHYWLFGHRFQCNVYTCHNGTASWQEQVARAAGQLANCAFGLLLLPCARNSVWTVAFGVPWEAAIEIHRRLGCCMLGCAKGGIGTALLQRGAHQRAPLV